MTTRDVPIVINVYPSHGATDAHLPDATTSSTRQTPSAPPTYDEALGYSSDLPLQPTEVCMRNHCVYV